MNACLPAVLTAAALIAAPAVSAQELVVQVDPRVELVSTLFRAAGRPEYNQGRVARWNTAVDSLFAANRGHEALTIANRLATRYNVGFFAPISLALHLRTSPTLSVISGLASAPSLHRTWTQFPDSTTAFVGTFAAFWREAQFESFLRGQTAVIGAAEQRLRTLVNTSVNRQWFAKFWGDTSIARLTVVPGLTVATASYGLDVVFPDGHRDGFAVIGIRKTDAGGLPSFDSTDVQTLIHELNHPYVTAVLRGAPSVLRGIADTLYRDAATAMRQIGYGSGDAMLNEALVRAAVIRYLATNVSAEAAAREIEAQRREGFVWINDIAAAFAEYDTNRNRYSTFGSFVPILADRMRAIAARPR